MDIYIFLTASVVASLLFVYANNNKEKSNTTTSDEIEGTLHKVKILNQHHQNKIANAGCTLEDRNRELIKDALNHLNSECKSIYLEEAFNGKSIRITTTTLLRRFKFTDCKLFMGDSGFMTISYCYDWSCNEFEEIGEIGFDTTGFTEYIVLG